MEFDLEKTDVASICRGYTQEVQSGNCACLCCGAVFEPGEVYPIGGRLFTGERAVRAHLEQAHPNRFEELLASDCRYLNLTSNQKRLLELLHSGRSDHEIASQMGISDSTVRHQKFTFREKAKQAKLYLAVYSLMMERPQCEKERIAPIHQHARMVDSRYVTTEQEREKIIAGAFSSLAPLKLRAFSPKEKKKIVILTKIAEEFERDRRYTEQQVNEVLSGIYEDYATLRRYLIEYGFMERTRDCKSYWRT